MPVKLWCNNYHGWFSGVTKDGAIKFSHNRDCAIPFADMSDKKLHSVRKKIWQMGIYNEIRDAPESGYAFDR